jgi:transglutaminase-like putative cysteine protease
VIHYLYPSRYCQSDRLLNFAQGEFGQWEPGYAQVTAICDWIYEKVLYLPGSSDSLTSATETLLKRVGVCRDFAHLGIALCRALNIPARFVSGYAHGLNPPDFHAWFEAYLGRDWCRFDPSRLVSPQSLVQVGVGRDAADVALATILGAVTLHRFQVLIEPLSYP